MWVAGAAHSGCTEHSLHTHCPRAVLRYGMTGYSHRAPTALLPANCACAPLLHHAADRSQSRPTDLVFPHLNPSPDLEGPWTCCCSTDCSLRSSRLFLIPHCGSVGSENTPDGRKMSRLDWTAFNTSSFTALTVSIYRLIPAIAWMVFRTANPIFTHSLNIFRIITKTLCVF